MEEDNIFRLTIPPFGTTYELYKEVERKIENKEIKLSLLYETSNHEYHFHFQNTDDLYHFVNKLAIICSIVEHEYPDKIEEMNKEIKHLKNY